MFGWLLFQYVMGYIVKNYECQQEGGSNQLKQHDSKVLKFYPSIKVHSCHASVLSWTIEKKRITIRFGQLEQELSSWWRHWFSLCCHLSRARRTFAGGRSLNFYRDSRFIITRHFSFYTSHPENIRSAYVRYLWKSYFLHDTESRQKYMNV